jgi:predicted nucleotidyltransferase
MPTDAAVEQITAYRTMARCRQEERAKRLGLRHERALKVAHQAAMVLKQQFGAKRVLMFGSVVSRDRFHGHSDIDLAVWGLAEELHYRAVGVILGIDPEFLLDLVRAESAPSGLLAAIDRDGIIL